MKMGIESGGAELITLVHIGPPHRDICEAGYEFYSDEPGAKGDHSVWENPPQDVIQKVEALFAKKERPVYEDWGI
jgi:hypothetical protein